MWILIGLAVLLILYYVFIKPYNYWKNKGVQQGNPMPIFGNNWRTILRLSPESILHELKRLYNTSETDRYIGLYFFHKPCFVPKDPKLIKTIMVKDADYFIDHRSFVEEDIDPLWGKNLLSLKGNRWRTMRAFLSPAFTGNKMRQMFILVSESSEQFVNHFLKMNKDLIPLEMKNIFTRFCNDVIASTAFGLKVDSLENPNNEFYLMGQKATDFSNLGTSLRFMANFACPQLCRLLNLKLFAVKVTDFFKNIVLDTIDYRRKNSVARPDMINLLLEAQKNEELNEENTKIKVTDEDIVSQALAFFFAGFDSVSSLMGFTAYELAINPDIQEKLIQEIDEIAENSLQLTYEDLSKMKYMDMVISESLRKWPPIIATDRVCTKPYTIEPERPGEKPVVIEKGIMISLLTYAIHHDPNFYSDPERFDPERFSEENKEKIDPYTFIPFGMGPRACIGVRLALMETKTLFYHLLRQFQIVPVEKTVIPLVLEPSAISVKVKNGLWLGFKRR